MLDVFDVKDHALLGVWCPGVYNRELCRRNLLRESVLKMGTSFWRK